MSAILSARTFYLQINRVCNSRCKYCHMWMNRTDADELNTEELVKLVAEAAEYFGSGANLVLYGGEPFLNKERLFSLCEQGRRLGFHVNAITNGSLLTEKNFPELWERGPDMLSISLDSHSAEIHDSARGLPGSHEATVELVRALVAYRDSNEQRRVALNIVSVLRKSTLPIAHTHVIFARTLGVDGIHFSPLSPTLDHKGKQDTYFSAEADVGRGTLDESLERLIEMKQGAYSDFLHNSEGDLNLMYQYFQSPLGDLSTPSCNAYQSVRVDTKGELTLCNYMVGTITRSSLGNVRETSLPSLLRSPLAQAAREKMRECRRACGALACHRV